MAKVEQILLPHLFVCVIVATHCSCFIFHFSFVGKNPARNITLLFVVPLYSTQYVPDDKEIYADPVAEIFENCCYKNYVSHCVVREK